MVYLNFTLRKNFIFVLAALLILIAGCEPHRSNQPARPFNGLDIYSEYQPTKVSFLPLTDIKKAPQENLTESINVFVSLLDSENAAIKSPAVFRFELYEHLSLSPESKGKRIHFWQDIDLTEFGENNQYWRDYLRAYEFKLELAPTSHKSYILELTCITPAGKRLINQYELNK